MTLPLEDRVTLCVVPRERWSLSVRSLRQILEHTPAGIELVYVDGGSPAEMAEELEQIVADHGGTYVRRDHVLGPNEARNLALPHATKEYLLFVDNDVEVSPGYLQPLVDRADATGAGAVGPLIMQGANADSKSVHIAGGHIEIDGDRLDTNIHAHHYATLDTLPDDANEAHESTQLEFHMMLIRRAVIDDIGPFDERMLSMCDHEDFVLLAHKAGWPLWYEPASRITYLLFVPLTVEDRGFWQTRWSEEWNETSLASFSEKWGLRRDVGWPEEARRWSSKHRMWWYHNQNRPMTFAGKVLRNLAMVPRLGVAVRNIEEQTLCRRGRHERRRRAALR